MPDYSCTRSHSPVARHSIVGLAIAVRKRRLRGRRGRHAAAAAAQHHLLHKGADAAAHLPARRKHTQILAFVFDRTFAANGY